MAGGPPAITNGALTLSAATATAVPTTALTNRSSVMIQNLDSAAIYVGGSTVTASNGIQIASNAWMSFGVDSTVPLYVYSSAGTAVSAVRYMEVRSWEVRTVR